MLTTKWYGSNQCLVFPLCSRVLKGLNLKNFIFISSGFTELLRKVSRGAGTAPPPPGEVGLNKNVMVYCNKKVKIPY